MSLLVDLDAEARRAPLDLRGTDRRVGDEDRARALINWRHRMASEHVSARVFAELASQAVRAGLPTAETARIAAMIGQELEHAVLCARVVRALGGEARAEAPGELPAVPTHDDVTPLEGLLRNAISIGCCSETVAVALVGAERELAPCPALADVLGSILADEVKHARFGWRLVDALVPTLDRRARDRLGGYLVSCFEHQLAFHAPFVRWGAATLEAQGIGVPDGPANARTFLDVMTKVTVPGLERVGLPAREAFAAAVERARAPIRRPPTTSGTTSGAAAPAAGAGWLPESVTASPSSPSTSSAQDTP